MTIMIQVTCLFFLASVLLNYQLVCAAMASPIEENAFSQNIHNCLLKTWEEEKILAPSAVSCESEDLVGLCYGSNPTAKFAVCYNQATLIPEFTAHEVLGVPGGKEEADKQWRNENGEFGKYVICTILL